MLYKTIQSIEHFYGHLHIEKDIIKRRFIEIIKLPGGLICSMTFLI